MARLNAYRRRQLKLDVATTLLGKARNDSTVASDGNIRSSHKPHVTIQLGFHAPRPTNFDGQGKRGRIVDGKVVSPRPKRFSN